jgi:hypothetical protein
MKIISLTAMILCVVLIYSGILLPVLGSTGTIPIIVGKKFQLGINETASVQPEGLEIKIVKIQDSRCPSTVVCIWEGRANVWIDIRQGQENKTINMTTKASVNNPSTVEFKNYSISLLQVDPYPQKGADIQLSNYTVTLLVTHSGIIPPLKQFKSGIAVNDVRCKESFVLVTKASDGSPACVTPQTSKVLVERGWAKIII